MVIAPLSGVSKLTTPRTGRATALHLAVTRSSAVRLSSVVSALARLGAPQAFADLGGELAIDPDAPPHIPAQAASSELLTEVIARTDPACVVVAGDGDAVLEGALTASTLGIPIVRLGAGLRSGDRSEDEEISRVALDDWLEASQAQDKALREHRRYIQELEPKVEGWRELEVRLTEAEHHLGTMPQLLREVEELRSERDLLRAERDGLLDNAHELQAAKASLSWRVTRPLREGKVMLARFGLGRR